MTRQFDSSTPPRRCATRPNLDFHLHFYFLWTWRRAFCDQRCVRVRSQLKDWMSPGPSAAGRPVGEFAKAGVLMCCSVAECWVVLTWGCLQIWSMGGPWLKLAGTRLKQLGPQRKTLFVAASAWTGARTCFWFPVGTWPVVLVFRRCRIASAQPVTHRSRPATVPSFDAQTPVSSWAAAVPPWAERCLLLRLPFRTCLRVCVCFRGSGLPVVGRKEGRTGERGGNQR